MSVSPTLPVFASRSHSFCKPLQVAANLDVVLWESLDGLEVRYEGRCLAVLREYRTFRQMLAYREEELPPAFYFEFCEGGICPRIAVAY